MNRTTPIIVYYFICSIRHYAKAILYSRALMTPNQTIISNLNYNTEHTTITLYAESQKVKTSRSTEWLNFWPTPGKKKLQTPKMQKKIIIINRKDNFSMNMRKS